MPFKHDVINKGVVELPSPPFNASNQSDCSVRIDYSAVLFLPLAGRDQKRVVALLSLDSPERMRRRWVVLGEFAKYAFFWPDKEKLIF